MDLALTFLANMSLPATPRLYMTANLNERLPQNVELKTPEHHKNCQPDYGYCDKMQTDS
jgi:hypothetical protein